MLCTTLFASLAIAYSTSMAVGASPLLLPFSDDLGAKQEDGLNQPPLIGRDVDVTSWHSMPLERSPSDPETIFVEMNDLQKRTVYNPPITYPTSSTVWTAGKVHEVKWKVRQEDIPPTANNYKAKVMLGYLPYGSNSNEHLYWTLAENFPITDESVKFRLPSDLATRSDYIVVLFGDSGNRSERFTINAKDGLHQEMHSSTNKDVPKQLIVNQKVDANTEDAGATEADTEQSPVEDLITNVLRDLPTKDLPGRSCRICLPL